MLTNFIVYGLLRKPRNGTPFYIQTPGNPMKGWATVLRREKTPTGDAISAKLQVSGLEFSFHAKDKTAWPDAKPERGVKVYRVKAKVKKSKKK
jgi:hypothetical protein